MVNGIPVLGWIISFIVNVSLAFPFWYCWTICEIGSKYFDFLPSNWQSISFWNCVGLFISVSIIKTVFIPKIITINQTNDN